jgi:hypothetical protein
MHVLSQPLQLLGVQDRPQAVNIQQLLVLLGGCWWGFVGGSQVAQGCCQ